jgi:hypothetical protein
MAKDGGGSILTLLLLGGAAYVAYQYFFASTSAAQASGTPASGTPATPATPVAPTNPSTGQLASLFSQLQQAGQTTAQTAASSNIGIVNGSVQATWSAWNNLLTKVAPSLTGLPAYSDVANQPDLNLEMSASQYWSLMGPWLTKNKGLSGAMAGLGALYSVGGR